MGGSRPKAVGGDAVARWSRTVSDMIVIGMRYVMRYTGIVAAGVQYFIVSMRGFSEFMSPDIV
jgi:hypothetical protein